MKKILRYLISKFGYKPYSLMLKILVLTAKIFNLDAEVWARNSYEHKTLEPGYSDLDVTIYIKKTSSLRNQESFLWFYTKLQKIFPLLGEINVYTDEVLDYIIKNHNSFELMRDPILCDRHNVNIPHDTVDAAVFLFRQLEVDIWNLQKHPEKRTKKWRAHLDVINRWLPEHRLTAQIPFKEDKIIETIMFSIIFLNNIRDPFEIDQLKDRLSFYFELLYKNVDFSELQYLINNDGWLTAWKSFRSPVENSMGTALSPKQVQFFIRQIKWESCGVLTQIKSQKDAESAITHFNKIIQFVQRISHLSYSSEIKTVLIDLNEAVLIAKRLTNI